MGSVEASSPSPDALRAVSLLTLAFFFPVAAGCLSHEYVIPQKELARLVDLPPAARGERVHVVQELGEREQEAVPTDHVADPYIVAPDPYDDPYTDVDVGIRINGDVTVGSGSSAGGGGGVRPAASTSWRGTSAKGSGGWRGTPSSSGGGDPWRGTPSSGGGSGSSSGSGGGWRGTSSSKGGGGSSSGGGGGGGGSNVGEAAVVLAVVLLAVAALAAVGLVASEGSRFDGYAQMWPGQPVHLQRTDGTNAVVPLGDLSPGDIAATVEAKVLDSEGYGIRRLESVLDRRGMVFKLDMGTMAFRRGDFAATGLSGDIGLGFFPTSSIGILLGTTLGGATDGLGDTLTRHAFFLEVEALPVAAARRLHFGGYVNGGIGFAATTADGGVAESGPAFGGGALVELDVTGRMALTLRGGVNVAQFESGWSPAANFGLGLAIY
jgi:hypothetical protein